MTKLEGRITRTGKPQSASPEPASQNEVSVLRWLMVGIIFVLLTTILGFVTNAVAEYRSSYTDLRDEVKAQNDKIDRLTAELNRANEITVTPDNQETTQ